MGQGIWGCGCVPPPAPDTDCPPLLTNLLPLFDTSVRGVRSKPLSGVLGGAVSLTGHCQTSLRLTLPDIPDTPLGVLGMFGNVQSGNVNQRDVGLQIFSLIHRQHPFGMSGDVKGGSQYQGKKLSVSGAGGGTHPQPCPPRGETKVLLSKQNR